MGLDEVVRQRNSPRDKTSARTWSPGVRELRRTISHERREGILRGVGEVSAGSISRRMNCISGWPTNSLATALSKTNSRADGAEEKIPKRRKECG